MKRSTFCLSVAMIGLFDAGLAKADEVFLSQANAGRITTLLGHMSSVEASAATTVATPVTALTALSSASTTSGLKQNVSQLSQVGTNNNALINQVGTGNISLASQQGRGNVAIVNQTSRSH